MLIAGARLGDILGRCRLFLVGSAGFTVFSAACALASGISVLIGFRALQGAFGALMIPQGFGLMREVFGDEEFDKATGMFGPAMGLPLVAAPILGGALVDANLWGTGWRLVFLINVPIGLVSFVLALRTLPRGASHSGMKLDVGGVWLIGLALVAIIYSLIQGQPEGWTAWTFVLLAAGLVLLLVFVAWEKRRKSDALIEPSLLTNHNYLSGVAVALGLFGAFAGVLLCVSLYGQLGEGWSPIHAGLTLTPMVIGMIAGMLGGTAAARLGRHVLYIGLLIMATGAAVLALALTGADAGSSWDLLPGLLLVGIGAGASFGQLYPFILSSVSMREVGSASGVLEATQQLSTSFGVAVLGTIFLSSFAHHPPTHALQITAWACMTPLAIAFARVFRLPAHARGKAATDTSDTRTPTSAAT
ncbi:MFS transporter [Candidatus Frankia alpina]|uniref:MFS transporter n=1 Tax=Candidatus Frankia alpina TaxID=2699483 RepID=UPI003013F807